MDASGWVDLLKYFKKHKDHVTGLIIFYVLEAICYYKLFPIISDCSFYYIEYWGFLLIGLVTYFSWACLTHRWFFRDGWKVLVWLLAWLVCSSIFPLFLLPFIQSKEIFMLPYVGVWGTILWSGFIFAILCLGRWACLKDDRLCVVFIVNVDDHKLYNIVGDAIHQTVGAIEYEFNKLHIVLPPLGFKKNEKECLKYINSSFMQADALIFAKVIKGDQDGNLGYVFTEFLSMVNGKRHKEKNFQDNILNRLLRVNVDGKIWNNYDLVTKECESKIRVASNIQSLLLMYCSAFYILLNNFEEAIPVAKQMYNLEKQDTSSAVFKLASLILQDAYLFSATKVEHNKHEYEMAYSQLLSFSRSMPELRLSPGYDMSMARLMFLLGNIKESKKHTKNARTKLGDHWGFYLNMGMYAMVENKVEEFVSRYKAMMKHPVQSPQITFAIEFIDDLLGKDAPDNIKTLLNCAKIILQAYMLPDKKWHRCKKAYVKSIEGNDEFKILIKLLSSVESNRPNLMTRMLLDTKTSRD